MVLRMQNLKNNLLIYIYIGRDGCCQPSGDVTALVRSYTSYNVCTAGCLIDNRELQACHFSDKHVDQR